MALPFYVCVIFLYEHIDVGETHGLPRSAGRLIRGGGSGGEVCFGRFAASRFDVGRFDFGQFDFGGFDAGGEIRVAVRLIVIGIVVRVFGLLLIGASGVLIAGLILLGIRVGFVTEVQTHFDVDLVCRQAG